MSELYEEITDCSGGSGGFEDSGSEYDGDSDLTSFENEESLRFFYVLSGFIKQQNYYK